MKKSTLSLASASVALAAMAALASPTARLNVSGPEPQELPKKRKRRAKTAKRVYVNHLSRGRYIPAGEYRNCGFNGISPKKVSHEKRV